VQIQELRLLGRDELRGIAEEGQELFEADLLLAHTLNASRVELLTHPELSIESEKIREYLQFLGRRKLHEPMAYIVGEREFFGFSFSITPDVLIPRPETELLVELLISKLVPLAEEGGTFTLIDVGTGSGAILLSIVRTLTDRFPESVISGSKFVGLDRSAEALQIAAKNANRLGVLANVLFGPSDLLSVLRSGKEWNLSKFPRPIFIVSNPPYIPNDEELPRTVQDFEPHIALRGGPDGLDLVRRLISEWRQFSIPEKEPIFIEIGAGQSSQIKSEFGEEFSIAVHPDLRGIDRVVELRSKQR